MKGPCCNFHVIFQLLPPLFSALPIQRIQQPTPASNTTLVNVNDIVKHTLPQEYDTD